MDNSCMDGGYTQGSSKSGKTQKPGSELLPATISSSERKVSHDHPRSHKVAMWQQAENSTKHRRGHPRKGE